MNRKNLQKLGLITLSLLLGFAFSCKKEVQKVEGRQDSDEKPYIAVVSKGEQLDFWQQVKRGSEDAAKKLNVHMTFNGPPSEKDIQVQVEMLNNALAKKPVAIALAALDTNSVIDQLQEAKENSIPIIGFDSGVPNAPSGSIYANASTDNRNAAGLAAKQMFAELKEDIENTTAEAPLKLVVASQDATGESVLSRGEGFRDNMIEEIISNTSLTQEDIRVEGNPAFIANDTPTKGTRVIIEMIVSATPNITDIVASISAVLNKAQDESLRGIFMSNEATAKGLLAATNDGADLPKSYPSLIAIGFDAGAGQKSAVRSGYFLGSVTQDPYSIGYNAIDLAYKAYLGEPISDVDTGAKFYTKENMDSPDIAPLLYD